MNARSTDFHLQYVLGGPFWTLMGGFRLSSLCMYNGIAGLKGEIVKSSYTHFIEHLLQDLCHTHLLSLTLDFLGL